MADDIAQLISEITRSPGSSDLGGAADRSRANRRRALASGGGRGSALVLGLAAVVALAVALTHARF